MQQCINELVFTVFIQDSNRGLNANFYSFSKTAYLHALHKFGLKLDCSD